MSGKARRRSIVLPVLGLASRPLTLASMQACTSTYVRRFGLYAGSSGY
jgi:hypothetical protein